MGEDQNKIGLGEERESDSERMRKKRVVAGNCFSQINKHKKQAERKKSFTEGRILT